MNVLVADMLHKGFQKDPDDYWYLTAEGWESMPAIKVKYSPEKQKFRDAVLEYNERYGAVRTLEMLKNIPDHMMLDDAAEYVKFDYQVQTVADEMSCKKI